MTVIINGSSGITNVNGTAAAPAETGTDTDSGIVYGTNTVSLATNGTEAMRVDASQNVLVGTTSNSGVDTGSQRLVVNGIGSNGAAICAIADTVGRGIRVTDSSKTYTAVYDMTTSLATLGTNQSIPLAFTTVGSERMRIDTSGNVGIGTTSPSQRFQVYDAAGANNIIMATNGAGASTFMQGTATYGTVGTINNFPLTFLSNNTERMRIDSSGNLLVGQTAQSGTEAFGITRAANTATYIHMLKSGQVECTWGFKSSTDSNMYIGTGSSAVGTYGLYQANTGTAWIAVSDERFKTELQPIENALEKITNVRTVTGRYTYDEENGRTARRSFLIAQDFVSALPEAVDQQDANKLGLSYTDTIPLLVAAIKELKALTDTQASTITALTARITALEVK
jgi:hypothetical protein